MATNAAKLSAQITLCADDITQKIEKLLSYQDDIQDDILKLQQDKRNGEKINEKLLKDLKQARKDAGTEIGLLSMKRTELFDDLPVIKLASGKLKVVAKELEKNAKLIEKATKKIEKTAKALKQAEALILKIIALVGMV